MPKPSLSPPYDALERDIIETLLAGLKEWRPDLAHPESHSDMQGCVRALLVMYDVKRRPLPLKLPSPCPDCEGLGQFTRMEGGVPYRTTCPKCEYGKVYY